MDDLSSMFGTGNPFITQMGQDAFDLSQKTKQQTLADLVQKNQQSAASFPLDQQVKQSNVEHNKALTRQSNVTSQISENAEAARPAVADRLKQAMQELHAKSNDTSRAQMDAEMYQRGQLAAMAKANGGTLPLNILSTLPEAERAYYSSPQSLDLTSKMVRAYHDTHPKTMEARAKEQAAFDRAKMVAEFGLKGREATANARGGGKAGPMKMTNEQAMVHYREQARIARAAGEEEQAQQLEAYADQAELAKLKGIDRAAAARREGSVDLANVPGSKIPTVVTPPATPTPRPDTKQWSPPAGWK